MRKDAEPNTGICPGDCIVFTSGLANNGSSIWQIGKFIKMVDSNFEVTDEDGRKFWVIRPAIRLMKPLGEPMIEFMKGIGEI
jgi:hypothetical protein